MAAELGLLPLTQLQKLSQSHHHQTLNPNLNPNPSSTSPGSWMWNPNPNSNGKTADRQDDDDSWEVRAFEEDTNHAMGTTWPPRSYTCTFCRREFRSAQALGGHMNVHRRDRARLHQTPPVASTSDASSPTLLIPTQEFVANGGLCLLYSLQNPNGMESPHSSNLLGISPYPPNNNNLMSPLPPSFNFPVASPSINSSLCHSSNTNPSASIDNDHHNQNNGEELDLELRLGRSS